MESILMANERAIEPVGTTLTIGSLSACYISIGNIGFTDQGEIDATCLSNTEYMTSQPPALKKSSDIPFTAFDYGDEFDDIEAEIQVNQALVITIPSVGAVTVYGWLASWEVQETGIGEAFQASGVIHVSNLNGSTETGPVFVAAV